MDDNHTEKHYCKFCPKTFTKKLHLRRHTLLGSVILIVLIPFYYVFCFLESQVHLPFFLIFHLTAIWLEILSFNRRHRYQKKIFKKNIYIYFISHIREKLITEILDKIQFGILYFSFDDDIFQFIFSISKHIFVSEIFKCR